MKKRIKWNPRFITSLFIAFMCTLNCMAQNVIKGSVNDGSGEPLPGVSVAVKGTTSGTITDLDGKFSINAHVKYLRYGRIYRFNKLKNCFSIIINYI